MSECLNVVKSQVLCTLQLHVDYNLYTFKNNVHVRVNMYLIEKTYTITVY